jgi:hypothetical protein
MNNQPTAWALMAYGRVQQLVVRADVADELACKLREGDPAATAVPLYTWAAVEAAAHEWLGAWVPAHERVPAIGTECVVLVRYSLDSPPFATVDKWEVQREDPTGMGGPTIETGEGWSHNFESDVIAWIAIPPHPPAEWDQRPTSKLGTTT